MQNGKNTKAKSIGNEKRYIERRNMGKMRGKGIGNEVCCSLVLTDYAACCCCLFVLLIYRPFLQSHSVSQPIIISSRECPPPSLTLLTYPFQTDVYAGINTRAGGERGGAEAGVGAG